MFKKDKAVSDAFTLSLGGIRTITSFAAAPAIAHDRLRQVQDRQVSDSGKRKWRLWMPKRLRVV